MNALANSAGMVQVRQQAREYWRARAPRERRLLVAAGIALAVLLVWWIAIQPAWNTLRQTPAQLDALETQLQQLQRLAAESQSLRGTAPVGTAQAGLALKAATDRLGDKARLTLLGDRATLTLNGVATEGLRGWLIEARSAARVRPIDAQLTRGAQGYSGTITVAFATGGAS